MTCLASSPCPSLDACLDPYPHQHPYPHPRPHPLLPQSRQVLSLHAGAKRAVDGLSAQLDQVSAALAKAERAYDAAHAELEALRAAPVPVPVTSDSSPGTGTEVAPSRVILPMTDGDMLAQYVSGTWRGLGCLMMRVVVALYG